MVILRPFEEKQDLAVLYAFYRDFDMQCLISQRIALKSFEEFREWLLFQLRNRYHEFRTIVVQEKPIGFCYSYEYRDGILKTTLAIQAEYQNTGIGIQAEILFLDELMKRYPIRKVYSDVYSYNEKSIRAHRHSGFVEEGCLKEYRYYNGQYHDLYIFSMSRTQFYERFQTYLAHLQKKPHNKNREADIDGR